MTKPSPPIARDTLDPVLLPARRRHHKKPPLKRKCGPLRPGRFFRQRKAIVWLRLEMKPADLGDADWLLYRRRFNPYRRSSYKFAAYERGFVSSKQLTPKPNWPPL